MNFFAKMAADLDNHPKIRKCREDRRAAREIFLFVLRRIAGEQTQGRVAIKNVEPWYLEDQLAIPEPEAERGLAACVRVELLELTDDEVIVVGWDDEWAKRPLTDAERQQRRRDRKRHGASRDVTDVTPDHESHGSEETREEEKRSVCGVDREHDHALTPEQEVDGTERRFELLEIDGHRIPQPFPQDFEPELSIENGQARRDALASGVVVDYELKKFRERHRGKKHPDWNARWREWLLKAHPTHASVRDAMTRADRDKTAQASRDRERAELAEQKQRAENDREDVRRAAKAALETGFQLPQKATHEN